MRSGDAKGRFSSGSPGFTLPAILLALALVSLGAGRAEVAASYRAQRDREAELFFRGGEFVRAIERFYLAEPDPAKRRLPANLDELEKDTRAAHARHLRRVYTDPLTGGDFLLLTASVNGASGLVGVASASDKPLLKRAGFGPEVPFPAALTRANELRFEVDPKTLAPAKPPPDAPPAIGPTGKAG